MSATAFRCKAKRPFAARVVLTLPASRGSRRVDGSQSAAY